MDRRRFLQAASTVSLGGLVAGCLNTEAKTDDPENGDRNTPTKTVSTPDDPRTVTETPTPTEDGEQNGASTKTTTVDEQSNAVGWSSGGTMDGLAFQFSSEQPDCGQGTDDADVRFDQDRMAVVFEGVISGSDRCKRARLSDLSYDRDEDILSIAVETVEQDGCVGAGQCIVDIAYEGSVTFEDALPGRVSASHNGRGLVSAAHDSASVGEPEATTSEN